MNDKPKKEMALDAMQFTLICEMHDKIVDLDERIEEIMVKVRNQTNEKGEK